MRFDIVIPAFNEEENIEILFHQIQKCLRNEDIYVIFVNDGSTDRTREVLLRLKKKNPESVGYIELATNYGHQEALRVGYESTKAEVVITLDADLQHPPEIIPKLISAWKEGYLIVNAIRVDGDVGWYKKITSNLYYMIWNYLSGYRLEPGTSDFRLVDRKVLDRLMSSKHGNLFFRGDIAKTKVPAFKVEFVPDKRLSGESKYTIKKMIHLAHTGIVLGSIMPLRIATVSAIIVALISLLFGSYSLYAHYFLEGVTVGWTSLIAIICLIGSAQLLSIGILGEYIAMLMVKRPNSTQPIIKDISTR